MSPIASFFISVSSGAIAAFLGSLWAVRRFYKQKTWERRERAYEEIVNALYDVIQYCAVQKEDYGQGTGLSEDKERELQSKYYSATSSLSKATDVGSFYISDNAYNVLTALRGRETLNPNEEPWFEIFESEYQEHKKALNKLMEIAKKDLHIRRT